MAVNKPFRRICRQFTDGSYFEGGNWQYLLHKKFAKDPRHYIRAFQILEQDLDELFNYVEPADINRSTYSHHMQQLLMRTCVEIEANLTAIMRENQYAKKGNLTMIDYKKVNYSHRLSSYEVRLPVWSGSCATRTPYSAWANQGELSWYRAYNKSKHDRHENFHEATFDNLIDAMCGLIVILSAQFHTENYSTAEKRLTIGPGYSYDTDDGMESAIGNLFRIKFPTDWPNEDRYEFNWNDLKDMDNPFDEFDYSAST